MLKLASGLDSSVNFVVPAEVGFFESRYVHRPDKDYFIAYLSSQSGCSRACRMCHLTASKQTKHQDATLDDFEAQATRVFEHWNSLGSNLKTVHFNFMARGEPLECKTVLDHGTALLQRLGCMAVMRGLEPRFLISTIMPQSFTLDELSGIFHERSQYLPEIYYSIYSIDPEFRNKWLPRAMRPDRAIAKLARWQQQTGKRPRIHFAFIKGENDRESDVLGICDLLNRYALDVDLNIVRYNPPNDQSEESDETVIECNAKLFRACLPRAEVRVIPRVGFDVQASCGTFFSGMHTLAG